MPKRPRIVEPDQPPKVDTFGPFNILKKVLVLSK